MNIFAVSRSPRICSQALDDLRLNKMILETAQILCTAYRTENIAPDDSNVIPYQNFNPKHHCILWARDRINNREWLWDYFFELHQEKLFRHGSTHKSYQKLVDSEMFQIFRNYDLSVNSFSVIVKPEPFVNCCPGFYHIKPTTLAYKMYLCNKWDNDLKEPRWTGRGAPSWRYNY